MADQPRPGSTQHSPNRAGMADHESDIPASGLASVAQPDWANPPEKPAPSLPDLIRDYAAPLYRYAFRLTGQASDAEDLVQQTFLVAQQKLHQLRQAERASSWLYAVLRSCFLKSRRKPLPQTLDDSFAIDSIADQPAGEGSVWLDREALQVALSELPDEFRIVVLMFYFEELSYKDIAEQLEIPIGTVMSRLSRGKAHLRRRLAPDEPDTNKANPSNERLGTRS